VIPPGLAWDAWRAGHGSPRGVARRQQARLEALIAFARARSPFYRGRYPGGPDGWATLRAVPPLSRRELMDRFDEIVTDPRVTRAGVEAFLAGPGSAGGLYLGRYQVWTSSGATAEPRIFLHDPEALAVYRTLSLVRGWLPWMTPRRFAAVLRRGDRVAAVVGTGGPFPSVRMLEHQRRHRPWPFDRFRVFPAQRPIAELVAELDAFQPAELVGYPSVLTALADEQRAGRLAIRPALVGCGGEWLGADHRRLIEAAFRCPVRENYGAAEFPQAVWDCPRARLHVGADWLVVEPVDAEHRPVPPGEPSHTTLVTNLANRVMPILRYDVGDSITMLPDPCPCGSPLPAIRVAGRQDDTLVMRSPAGAPVHMVPIVLGMTLGRTPGLRRFQIIQIGPARLRLRLEPEPGADPAGVWDGAVQRLQALLAGHALPHVEIERSPDPPGIDPRHGKFRRIWAAPEAPPGR
jgi:phenylacetate-coenzyme A ligase PaaK-like adenylate-forming protein